jgi:hypothetical protein
MAGDFEGTIGPRVEELLGYLEEDGDLETFRARLNAMAKELPPAPIVERIRNTGFIARMLGALRAQR